ncbi:unnamed protein product [Calypogeia fissa]
MRLRGSHEARTSTKPCSKPATPKVGMYAGRVKANPLKYLATVLRSKLQPHYEACNLLGVATEIHDEAKNKHNTTLRRIYDVVNVLEAAGLLERSNGSTPKKSRNQSNAVTGLPSAECSQSAVDFGVDVKKCKDEQIDVYSRSRTTSPAKKQNRLEKKSTRGSRIRWLGPGSESEKRCHTDTLCRLTEQKIAAVQRISEKQRELEYLQEELRLTTELIKHNQSRIYRSDRSNEANMNPCTPPPEDLSYSYLNFEDCSQTSAETECSHEALELQAVFPAAATNDASTMCGYSLWSSSTQEFHPALNRLSTITEAGICYDFNPSALEEVGMNILEAAEQYQSNSLPRPISGTAEKGLHVPFIILQTKNSTNVDIDLASNVTSEVSILLDDEYKLFDYRDLLSSMFLAQDRDGGSSYT